MYPSAYLLVFFAAALASSFVYAAWLSKKKRAMYLLPLGASVLTVLIIYLLLGQYRLSANYMILATEFGVALVSSILVQLYLLKPRVFITLILLLLSGFFLYSYSHITGFAPMGVFGISTMYGLFYRSMDNKPARRPAKKERSKEVSRDVVQIMLGIVLVAVLILLKFNVAAPVVFALTIWGYFVNNLAGEKTLKGMHRPLESKLERTGAIYGSGALYLAAGMALIMGFANDSPLAIFGVMVLCFSDSLATIVGINFGALKLPYNKNKSVMGTLAFFLATALLGYLVIGPTAIVLGLLLAFVESADTRVDDNVSLAIAVVIVSVLAHL
jgi:dolichol kinase